MRLAVSHTYFNKKLDEFGQGHDDDILEMMELQKIELQKAFPTTKQPQVIEMGVDSDDGNSSLTNASKAIFAQRLALIEEIPHSDLEINFSVPVMKNCPVSYIKFLIPILIKNGLHCVYSGLGNIKVISDKS